MPLKVIFLGLAVMVCASAVMTAEVTDRDEVTMPNADVEEASNANEVPDGFMDISDEEEESLNNLSADDVSQSEPLKEDESLGDEASEEPQEDEEKVDEAPSDDDVSPSEPLEDEESFEEETPEEPNEDEGETPEAEDDKSPEEPSDEDFETSEVAEDEGSNEELCEGEPCNQPLEDEVENESLPEDEPTSVIEDEGDDEDVFHEENEAKIAEDEDAPTVAEDEAESDAESDDPKAKTSKLPNPCKTKNGGCSDKCYNLFGHAFCFCTKPGQTLGTDTKSCVAIDKGPCSKKNGGCSDKCINVFGDAVCVCTKTGHVLDKSKKKCVKLVCPSMKCTKKCQYGFQKDDNGCDTCECNRLACPLKTCLLVCPIGYVLDKNGCAKCQCKLPLPGPTTLKQELIHLNVAGKPKSKEVRVRLTLDAFKYQALRFVPETCYLAASKLSINPIRTYLVKFRYPVDKTYIQRQLTPTEFEFSFKKNLKNYQKDVLNYLHCRCRVCSKNSSQCNFANTKVLGKLSANKKEDESADESDGEVYQDEYVNVSALVE